MALFLLMTSKEGITAGLGCLEKRFNPKSLFLLTTVQYRKGLFAAS